jgi:hypothetical protein
VAILQISKIQVRRGLYENLPEPLSSGEFGWALDQRRLFIGNGLTAEGAPLIGNTEIITEHNVKDWLTFKGTYQFHGLAAGFDVLTGGSVMDPAMRSWSSKFDDIVNLRDFSTTEDETGATNGIGDGLIHGEDGIENAVDVFNRAITHLYKISVLETEPRVRRTLNIPAGIYMLSGDFIRLLPYVKLKGEGKNCTFIVQTDPGQPCVLSSSDSLGNTGFDTPVQINLTSSQPGKIEVEGITLIAENDQDVLILDSVADAFFNRVAIQGSIANTHQLNGTGLNSCVRLNGPIGVAAESHDILFANCDFSQQTTGFFCIDHAYNIKFINCHFSYFFRGISIGQGGATPYGVKITDSFFEEIHHEAIYTSVNTTNISSLGNHFRWVGNGFSEGPISPIINFGGKNSYSIGDTFDSPYDLLTYPPVELNGLGSFATLPDGQLLLGQQLSVGGQTYTLTNNSTDQYLGILSSATWCPTIMEYRIMVQGGGGDRIGAMKIMSQMESNPIYDDEYVESDRTDITIWPWMNQHSGLMEIWYNAGPTGSDATLKITSRTLI